MRPKLSGGQPAGWRAKWLQLHKARKPNSSPVHLCRATLSHAILSCTLLQDLAPPPRDLRKTGQGSGRTLSQVLTHWKGSWEWQEPRSRRLGGYLRTQVWSQEGRRTCTGLPEKPWLLPPNPCLAPGRLECQGPYLCSCPMWACRQSTWPLEVRKD